MPRRIPDYPDAYWGWNKVASIGSLITLFSAILFIYIVYDLLTTQIYINESPREFFYSWLSLQYIHLTEDLPPHFFDNNDDRADTTDESESCHDTDTK